MKLAKRLDAIEKRAHPKRGQRLFVQWDDGRGITEGGEARTRQDVGDAERQGFDVVVIHVIHGAATR